jgi:hypothetical protein
VTAVCETKLRVTGNIYWVIQLFFCLVVHVADYPWTVCITAEIRYFLCYCLWTNRINKWLISLLCYKKLSMFYANYSS